MLRQAGRQDKNKFFYHEGAKVHEVLTEIMVFFSSWFFVSLRGEQKNREISEILRLRSGRRLWIIEQLSFKTCRYLDAKLEKFEDSSIGSGVTTYG